MSRARTAVPELFLGLLSLAIAAVWIGHIFASTIHDAKHTTDTISITASARKPISSDLVQWTVSVDGKASTPVAAARRLRRASSAVVAFLRGAGLKTEEISPRVVSSDEIVTRVNKRLTRTTYVVSQSFDVSTRAIDTVQAAATGVGRLLEQGIRVSAQPLAFISTRRPNSVNIMTATSSARPRRATSSRNARTASAVYIKRRACTSPCCTCVSNAFPA